MKAFIFLATFLLFSLLIIPILIYLRFNLKARRHEILGAFNEASIMLYFRLFKPGTTLPAAVAEGGDDRGVCSAFETYYKSQFGGKHFMGPTILLAAIAATLLVWSAYSANGWLTGTATQEGHLPELAVAAFMGGYMYAIYELIQRWYATSLSPAELLWFAFRIAFSIPMGYALTAALAPNLGPPVAFLLGAFPMAAIMNFARRAGAKALGQGDAPEGGDTELLKLDGIDTRVAARLAAEEITTPAQLAYADPVKLAIRTNLGFTFLSDCACQALLHVYAADRFQDFQRASLRGSCEVRNLLLAVKDDPGSESAKEAVKTLNTIAAQLQIHPDILLNFMQEIGRDPFTGFHAEVFAQV